MAEKLKYNKTALKAQRDAKSKYEKFLPILQLKKMQLQIVIRQMEPIIEEKRRKLQETTDRIRPWSRFLTDPAVDINDFLVIREVVTETDNIAGVDVPEFKKVVFEEVDYSLFATPSWLDTVVSALRMLVSIREELRVLLRKEELIRDELRTTTQRTNLFEKKLIPELKENIRKIRIFLGDEETAAVGRAKLAKAKIQQSEASR
ncbi:MAG: V-type ATP synthase subunit D [Deltaproteobacteria bacterium HGW-Deltaproteobacteria-21]|jgi:V/A-type H+-transporting ATPase subunit D|nr:MAG: V-type ATP synthase subunit D [Deltaproteobacteria bacterium HGW-Deltaproteobacteria-21]PKN62332.1 MAG: V-type ATP synthase subunit D [Deltaproteobacteria bacterium HGW-Deltaproteobacteria-15]